MGVNGSVVLELSLNALSLQTRWPTCRRVTGTEIPEEIAGEGDIVGQARFIEEAFGIAA